MSDKKSYKYLIGKCINEFKIQSILGQGSMGIVFLGFDTNLNRSVALKVLRREVVTEQNKLLERFKIEAINIAKLQHPNIINVYSIGYDEKEDLHYIAMEYVKGVKFSDLIFDNLLTLEQILDIIYLVSKTLKYSFNNDVIHRDIKPANIMINEDKEVKVVDFGLSKNIIAASNISTYNDLIGTPVYMAPELWDSSENVSEKSDIYSLGIVLYEALLKHPPFEGGTNQELYKSILLNRYVQIKDARPELPVELSILVNGMIHKDKILRYDIDHVLSRLSHVIDIVKSNKENVESIGDAPIDHLIDKKETTVDQSTIILSPLSTQLESDYKQKEKNFLIGIGLFLLLSILGLIYVLF